MVRCQLFLNTFFFQLPGTENLEYPALWQGLLLRVSILSGHLDCVVSKDTCNISLNRNKSCQIVGYAINSELWCLFLATEKIIVATRIWIWTSSNIFFNFLALPKDCTHLHKLDSHSKRSCDNRTIPRYSPFTKSLKKKFLFFN